MNETTHWCEDKDTLLDYLYGELEAEGRRVFEGHLRTCVSCAREVDELRGVRQDLAAWLPPEAELGFTLSPKTAAPMAVQPAIEVHPPRWAWSSVPAWARAAAAILVIGAGLGLANVQVRYDADGLSVSTGWMAPASPASSAAPRASAALVETSAASPTAWRPELAALEADLRKELQAIRASAPSAVPVTVARGSADDQAVLRRVQALIEDSEKRQEKALALRMGQFGRDFEMQRRVDLARVEQGFGRFEGRTGADLARQRQVIDYLVRVSATKVP